MITLKPAKPGLKIPHPDFPKRYLKEEGESVKDSSYWVRRVVDGEAIIVIKS